MDKKADIWYLHNSAFAIETENHLLIFDYYMNTPVRKPGNLSTGMIDPIEIQDKDVFVFSSHGHYDHFNPIIFTWREKVKNIRYILSSDIDAPKSPDTIFVDPGMRYSIDDISIDVLDSTDIGVSFLVNVDKINIFHSGDLNWWHWKGLSDKDNKYMEIAYKKQIDMLKGKHIDLAFIPVDPRLQEFYVLGLNYFMAIVGAEKVFPMHFGNNFSIFQTLRGDIASKEYYSKIETIEHRGQYFKMGCGISG